MFRIEDRVLASGQSQLTPQFIDRLRPFARHKPRQPPHRASHPLYLVRPSKPGIRRQHRRIECREKRERRQYVTRPRNPRHLRHNRACVIQLAQQQQVRARRLGRRIQQIVIRLPQHRKQKLPQPGLCSLLYVVDHLHEQRVCGVDVRPQRVKLEAERLNLRPVDVGQRHHRHVSPPLQLQRNRNQWIDVPKRPNVRQNNAQSWLPNA